MPVKSCSADGKSGYKWGDQGHCYTYSDETSRKQAKRKAFIQGYAAVKNGAKAGGYVPSIVNQLDLTSVQVDVGITDEALRELDQYFTSNMSEEDIDNVCNLLNTRCPI